MRDPVQLEEQRELMAQLDRLRDALRTAPPAVQVELEQKIADIEKRREQLALETRNEASMEGGSEA